MKLECRRKTREIYGSGCKEKKIEISYNFFCLNVPMWYKAMGKTRNTYIFEFEEIGYKKINVMKDKCKFLKGLVVSL